MSAIPSDSRAAIVDCWNRIGVRGDGSCVELQRHVHCRNCPVYATAAVVLLDGSVPPGYLEEWTGRIAAQQHITEAGVDSVLIFRSGEEWFGLPTTVVAEVGAMRSIHSLPHRSGGIVLGLVNVRGELLICASFTELLGLGKLPQAGKEMSHGVRQRLLVLSRDGDRVVFPVDQVHGTHRFHPRELKEVPATIAQAAATYIKAILPWGEKTVGMLDDELMLYSVNHNLA